MGAALLRHALAAQPEPLRSLKVVSAGVASRSGQAAIDLKGHLSQPLTQGLLDHALLVLCMTGAHRDMIEDMAEPAPQRVHLFRDFTGAKGEREIPDPYGLPLPAYESSRDEMVAAVPSIIAYLQKLPAAALSGR